MRSSLAALVSMIAFIVCGCSPSDSPESSASPDLKHNASVLANQLRAKITSDELMSLEFVGERASDNGGLRVQRQVEIATPAWIDLVSHGIEAKDAVDALLQDDDASVRLCTATLLSKIKVSDRLEPIHTENFTNLVIPMLERSLESNDPKIRYCGASGLGDLHRWSDELLERLGASLPKLRTLANDGNAEVRSVALIAYRLILGSLAERSSDLTVQQASRDELTKLEGQNW